MMEFSCHTWAFNDLPLTDALGTIARLGFRCVDIGSGPHLNAAKAAADPQRIAAEIKRDLMLFNLALSDVYIMLPRISEADDKKRQQHIDLFKALVPFAKMLETPGITISPGVKQPETDTEAVDRTVAALREMLKVAQEAGIQLSIEPHMDSIAPKPEIALKLLNEVPGLSLTLDWAHMVCQDVFHKETAELIPRARHIQIRQAARAQLQTPFDRGRIDVPRVVEAIVEAKYSGVVCVEYMKTVGWHGMLEVNAIREVSRMRDELRKARDKALRDS